MNKYTLNNIFVATKLSAWLAVKVPMEKGPSITHAYYVLHAKMADWVGNFPWILFLGYVFREGQNNFFSDFE